MEGNNYLVWKKTKESANKCEFLVFKTLAKELSQKSYRDISKGYIFIMPEDVEKTFRLIPLARESIKGVGVDLGGGVGCISSILAKRDEVDQIYCIEYTEDLIKLCQPVIKRGILKEKVNKVISVVGDFNNLELENNSVDFAVAWDSIHHSSDLVKTLKECRRVLKKGGRLIMVDRANNNSTPDSEIERMHNIVYDKEYLRKNYLDENIILTRKDYGEHEWRFFEWKKYFNDAGLKLLEAIMIKKDTSDNRKLKNDDNLIEIFVNFDLGGFCHRKVIFVLEA